MTTRVVIRALAERDVQHALDWYVENAPAQVGRLTADLRETIDRTRASPRVFRVVYRDIRRAALRRFPRLVWFAYFDEVDAGRVLAFSHQRQDHERVLKLADCRSLLPNSVERVQFAEDRSDVSTPSTRAGTSTAATR